MKIDVYQEVTNQIIEQMETLGNDWMMPFTHRSGMPQNATTKAYYQGINVLLLGMFSAFSSNEWASYKQWQSKGAQVIKGSKGTRIIFFKMLESKKKKGDFFPMIRYSTVFNAEQVEGYTPKAEAPEVDLTTRLAAVDAYVSNTLADIREGDRAFYRPSTDSIDMPARSQFLANDTGTATEHYYAVLLHELTHWTGAKTRLDRLDDRSREGYAFEELIAELGSAFNCRKLGIDCEVREDHAQYLASWLKALKGDKKFIFKASTRAQKAVEFLDGLQPADISMAA